jgi:hypothetical protein
VTNRGPKSIYVSVNRIGCKSDPFLGRTPSVFLSVPVSIADMLLLPASATHWVVIAPGLGEVALDAMADLTHDASRGADRDWFFFTGGSAGFAEVRRNTG